MTTPSLGFEQDSTMSKSQIAVVQLNAAISLFVQERFLAALTLAGAAEEILGKLLLRRGALPAIKETTAAISQLRAETGLRVMGDVSERELIDAWNEARNIAKHLIGPEGESVTLNLCDEAYWMIRRALANSERLGLRVAEAQDFENWVIINVNM
jgi:hypothetical protein